MAGLIVGAVAIGLLFHSTIAFLWLAGVSIALIVWAAIGLKVLPKVAFELEDLSPGAQDLLNRYNHAWVAPAMTKAAASFIGAWQFVSVVAAIAFFVRSEYLLLAAAVVEFFALALAQGMINPALHIRHRGLNDEADELAGAFVRNQRHSAAVNGAMRAL